MEIKNRRRTKKNATNSNDTQNETGKETHEKLTKQRKKRAIKMGN